MKKRISLVVFLMAILIIGTVLFFFHTDIQDFLTNLGYTPPADIVALETKLSLTDKGKAIFEASRPALEDSTDFNEHCKSHNADISVLGCYTNQNIYIYNIISEELPGITESTAAHELLHAVWERLPSWEKAALKPTLESIYEANREALSSDLEIYTDDKLIDELHSRIGTQVTHLPSNLATHYAKYFTNQAAVVAYYDQYITPFRQLNAEITALGEELESEKATIDRQSQEYYAAVDSLSQRINDFNACAQRVGCFTTNTIFNTQRATLIAEQDRLENLYNNINTAIEAYNQKAETYNQNILRTKNLENIINSNAPPQEELSD